jgi:hypothetical protein
MKVQNIIGRFTNTDKNRQEVRKLKLLRGVKKIETCLQN